MIKKNFSLFFISLILSCLGFSQNIIFSDSIHWSNKIVSISFNNENITENIIFSNKLFYNSDNFLPYYSFKRKIQSSSKISKIEFKSVIFEEIDENLLRKVKNLELIKNEIEFSSWISTSRKNDYLNLNFIPLRKNNITGKIERLVYFECEVYILYNGIKSKSGWNYASSSVLSNGRFYKIKVNESKMYKLTYAQLIEMGFSSADMNNIGVFGYGSMLSKAVSSDYTDDLPEIPVYKVDVNNNGIFDSGDYFLFYAEGPNKINYNVDGNFSHKLHDYSDYSYYFVSNKGTWKTAATTTSPTTSNLNVTTFDEYRFFEKDSLNFLSSGREWYWRSFDINYIQNYSLTDNNINIGDPVKIFVNMAIRSSTTSNFTVKLNGTSSAPTQCDGFNISSSVFAKAVLFSGNFNNNSTTLNATITYNKSGSSSTAWLDYIAFGYRKKLLLNSGFLMFRDIKSVLTGNIAKYIINDANQNTVVWEITDIQNIKKIIGNYNSGQYSFNANADKLKEFLAFDPYYNNYSSPIYSNAKDVGLVQNQNLHRLENIDLIIVTHPNFFNQAKGFQNLHEQYDNMNVAVVTPQEIYNEFSSGAADISAIRNFVKMLYDRAASTTSQLPRNLLLLGDGSFNNKADDPNITNFILTYQSLTSLMSNGSFVSDDFFVCLDYGEGDNGFGDFGDIDLGVGRIPVKTTEEAENYLNKTRAYYTQSNNNWKNNVLLIADDADKANETSFGNKMNSISQLLKDNHPIFNVNNLFLDSFEPVSTINGQRYPSVNQAFFDAMHNGVFIVSWLGHGSPKTWAHEVILDVPTIKSWKNTNKYPIFITATCDFSPFDLHTIVSGGEEVLLNPNGGGIALFTTMREVFGASGEKYTEYFMKAILETDNNNNYYSLGEAMMNAKNYDASNNKRDFIILGDPAIIPPFPKYNVVTTKINDIDVNNFIDTLKAKTLVKISGYVQNKSGNKATNFNGIIYPTVFDKYMSYTTRGNDLGNPMPFQAQQNILFNGRANVVNGDFTFSFMVPIDIAYFYDNGKISYYAIDNIKNIDANGYYNDFLIGGTNKNEISDNDGPEIKIYLNTKDFVNGGITNEKPILLVSLKDTSGINTVGNGIGHDIILKINDNTSNTINLNKFYQAKLDDFTSGDINYQMPELQLGQHNIKLKAWDVFNNSSEKQLDFVVTNSNELFIDHILNYPNPFSTYTEFYISHNQPFVELNVLIQIFTVSGKHVRTLKEDIVCDGFMIPPIPWNGLDEYGDKIAKGVYIYKVTVRDKNKNNKIEKYEKLMILN